MDNLNKSGVAPISIRRTFQAPCARVFAAFTEAADMRRWMCPPGFTIIETTVEPREGGAYRIGMRYPQGDNAQWTHANPSNTTTAFGVFTEFRKPEHIAYTIRHDGDPRDEFVTADFLDRGAQTDVLFKHDGFANERSRDEYEYGWNGAFEQLAALLANE